MNTTPSRSRRRKMLRAVIYIRYSSHKQHGNYSVEYQHDECMNYIEKRGYKFVKQYVDQAQSGKKTAGRDAFHQMIRDGEAGKFDVIVVFSFSRSFRNTRDALNYIMDMMEKSSIIWESVIEPIDMSNPHGKFSATNLFSFHELQSDITAAHVKSSMYVAAQQGYYLGGFVPYGYKLIGTGEYSRGKERKKYASHDVEAENVIKMFEMYADGFSLTQVQEEMKKIGAIGRRGGVMGDQTIARILKNEFYIGTRQYTIKGYDPLHIENAVPAIIPPELWTRVQTRHAKQDPKPRRTKRLYSLTGKIYCEKCGAHMFGVYKGDKRSDNWSYAYYHCATKKNTRMCDMKNIRKDRIDAYCMDQIKKHILNPERIDQLAAEIAHIAGSEPDQVKNDLKTARTRRTKIAENLKNLLRKEIEEDIIDDITRELKAEYKSELADLDMLIMQLESQEQHSISIESVREYLTSMMENVDSMDAELQKAIFDQFVDRIVISDDKVELFLIVSPLAQFGDKLECGHPHVTVSPTVTRKVFDEFY